MPRCSYPRDPETGKRYWLPQCIGGAAMGSRFCTCWGNSMAKRTKVQRELDEMEEAAVKTQNQKLIQLARSIRHEVEQLIEQAMKNQ